MNAGNGEKRSGDAVLGLDGVEVSIIAPLLLP